MSEDAKEVLRHILKIHIARYIVVETKYTAHHIELLSGTCKDRGRYKWIAETKVDAWDNVERDDEARRSHVDGGDLFPRVYFFDDSLCNELFMWLKVRNLAVTDITTPKY
jgi:hypothetical protein